MLMENESQSKPGNLLFVRGALKIFFPKHKVSGLENIPTTIPVVFVSNHAENYGPIVLSLYFPRHFCPWVIADMLSKDSIVDFMETHFTQKSLHLKPPFSRLITRLLSFFVLRVLHTVQSIPVYNGCMQIRETISQSIETLQKGLDLIIFPEDPGKTFSKYMDDFHIGFFNLARQYFKATGKQLVFYPVYVDRKHRTITVGQGIPYENPRDFQNERTRIVHYLRDAINTMAIDADK